MALYVVARVLHILAGVFWVGAIFFLVRFLAPAVGRVPGGPGVMQALNTQTRFPAAIGGAAGLTMLSGLILYGVDSRGFQGAWILSPTGLTFTLGALAAIGAAIAWIAIGRPAVERLPFAKDAERAALQRRAARGSGSASALLALAVIAMAAARYV
ncbi:MAG TPA: hypothetical protein VE591_11190 [Candidatus Acidoferrum sp.]|nr:hypothetical protein [Candidatus Acidoferrum sp.]